MVMMEYEWTGSIDESILDIEVVSCCNHSKEPAGLTMERKDSIFKIITADEKFVVMLRLERRLVGILCSEI